MIQVSLVGYASAGAFLGLAYFDYYYTLIALVVLCKTALISRAVDNVPESAVKVAERPLPGRPVAIPGWSALKGSGPAGGAGERR
jgi:hypothetical protein